MNNYYLSKIGIQRWVERQSASKVPFVCISLKKGNTVVGYLLMDGQESVHVDPKIQQLITSMLRAINLCLGDDMDCPQEELNQAKNTQIIITMGEVAGSYVAETSRVIKLCSPREMLHSPLRKKETWGKLRNFT